MRPSPTAIFLVSAVALVVAVGAAARSASGADPDLALPSDAPRLGFVVTGNATGVALLDATRAFRIDLGNGPVHGQAAVGERRDRARAIVVRELARYPSTFLRAARVRGIVLADALMEGERAIPSLPNVGGLLLLDVDGTERDLVRGLHHEIFHFADLADDGRLAPDAAWESLTPGFAYGAGGRTLRAAWAAEGTRDLGGFVSAYATSGVEEDKADTFAFAMARRDELVVRVASDRVLAAKVHELTSRVASLDATAPHALGLDQISAPPR